MISLKNLNKVTSDKTKHALVENELDEISKNVEAISMKLLTKNLINGYKIRNGAKYFSSRILQNYLVFTPDKKYFKFFSGATQIYFGKSNRIFEESIENITTSDNTFASILIGTCPLQVVKFNGNCLIRNHVYNFRKIINLYIYYTLNTWSRNLNTGFILNNCLLVYLKLTNNLIQINTNIADTA